MAFKMRNPFKQKKTSGLGPVEKCPDGKIWCKEAGKCLTPEACEDAKGLDSGSNRKVFKDGSKNRTIVRGKDGKTKVLKSDWQAHQFKK